MDIERSIWLPFPPSVNVAFKPRVVRKGRRYFAVMHTSTQYTAWKRGAMARLLAQRWPRYENPVVIKLELTPGSSTERDCDNYFKCVFDTLVKARILKDDSNRHIKACIAFWHEPSRKAGVLVRIRPAENARPVLSSNERRTLARIKAKGVFLVPSAARVTKGQQGLIDKGYIIAQPGLLSGQPQGYVVA